MDTGGSGIMESLVDSTRPGAGVPVIALTRRGDLTAKLTAFDRGVDDFLTVPFSPEEFVSRVLAVMRWTCTSASSSTANPRPDP